MSELYEVLLGPTFKGISREKVNEDMSRDEEDVRQCIARGEIDQLRGAALYNRTWNVSDRYCNVGDGIDSLEGHIHSIWHSYYQLARYTSHESTNHDRLVLDILRIRGLGPLTRPVSGCYGINVARTVEGIVWTDLPFLVTDMTKFWMDNCAPLSSAHRLNFTSFLAKLASTRVCNDKICQIALVLFRQTLEVGRDLDTGEESDEEAKKRTMRSLDMVHLLPSVATWIKEARFNLLQLSDVSWNDCPSLVGQGGTLFVESEFGRRCSGGFSPWRWMFWLKRLHEIRDEAREANENGLVEHATDCIEWMCNSAEERNSEILRAFQNGGKDLHHDPHLSCLKGLIKDQVHDDES